MSSTSSSSAVNIGTSMALSTLGRFIPAPTRRAGVIFRNVLGAVNGALTGAGSFPGVDPEYVAIMQEQIRVQQQMQLVSLFSNIEKSKHETQMVSIRNLRVG